MDKRGKTLAAIFAGMVGFFLLLGIVGDYDYAESVILHMSISEYEWVKDTLTKQDGECPTEREIAHWWAEHHGEYGQ